MFDSFIDILHQNSNNLDIEYVALRLFTAVILSSIIGCERANKRHSAGLRTFILSSFSTSIAMIMDLYLIQNTSVNMPILSSLSILSISILSSKTILFSSRNQIKGLTTSVGLWTCGLIGLTSGAGLYLISIVSFAILFCILKYLPLVEIYLKNRSNHFEIHLELKSRENLQDFVTTIRRLGLRIDDIEFNSAYHGSGLSVYSVTFTIDSNELKKYKTHSEIIQALSTIDYIYHIEEMK
jgi:hypothetical protein